jgi:hypothetical protein
MRVRHHYEYDFDSLMYIVTEKNEFDKLVT